MRENVNIDKSCFGLYHTKDFDLQPNGTQSMIFNTSDSGHFYMSIEDKERKNMMYKLAGTPPNIF
jgi:hypothetical protein